MIRSQDTPAQDLAAILSLYGCPVNAEVERIGEILNIG
jgi:hypothetical protein